MASIKVQPKNYSMVTTNKFLGMNVENELQLNPGEFVDMENFRITKDYKLEKRNGFESFEIDVGEHIKYKNFFFDNRLFVQLLNDDKPYLYVQAYSDLIDLNEEFDLSEEEENPAYETALLKVDADGMKVKKVFDSEYIYPLSRYNMFIFNKELYSFEPSHTVHAGFPYKYSGGDGSFTLVEPTIPIVFFQAKPDGSDWTSKAYQPLNTISNRYIINYMADNTSVDYFFPLVDRGEESRNVWEVRINGSKVVHFTAHANRIVFEYPPTTGAVVEVEMITYFSSADNNPARLVMRTTKSMWYGGQNDMDLFVWGNPDHPSAVYHSYAGDPLYFSDVGFRTFGDETITDIVVQNTTQLVFGEKSIFRTVIKTNESVANLIEYDAELIIRSKGHKKWTPNTNVQIIDNRPVFISEDGTINELVIISDRDERNIRQLSNRDMSSVLRSTDAVTRVITSTFDFEPEKEYWILFDETTQGETTHKALIYNYGNDTWYKYSGLYDCATPLLINYQMYMFGDVFSKMDESLFADIDINGISHAISAYATTPFLSFNKDFLYKSVQKLFISLSNNFEKDSYVKVEYWTSEEPRRQSINCYLRAGEPPRTESKVIGASRFMFMKFSFISDRVDNACTLINYSVKLHYAGEVRT